MRALLEEIDYAPGEATLLYRASTEADLVLRGELDGLAAARGARVRYLTGPQARPGSWLPQEFEHLSDAAALRLLVPEIADSDVYVCGPEQWMAAVRRSVGEAGVPRHRIHEERFSW